MGLLLRRGGEPVGDHRSERARAHAVELDVARLVACAALDRLGLRAQRIRLSGDLGRPLLRDAATPAYRRGSSSNHQSPGVPRRQATFATPTTTTRHANSSSRRRSSFANNGNATCMGSATTLFFGASHQCELRSIGGIVPGTPALAVSPGRYNPPFPAAASTSRHPGGTPVGCREDNRWYRAFHCGEPSAAVREPLHDPSGLPWRR